MKKSLLLLTLCFFFVHAAVGQDYVSPASWQPKLTIDGSFKDWPQPFHFFDVNTGLAFAVGNDDSNLYLCFINKDQRKTMKMMRAGWKLELWGKSKKKSFDASIVFPPIQLTIVGNKTTFHDIEKRPDFATMMDSYKFQLSSVNTKGFTTDNGVLALKESKSILVRVGSDTSHTVIYEIAIPYTSLTVSDAVALLDQFSMKVTVNGLEKPAPETSAGGSGGGFNGGGGFAGGRGGMPGGRSRMGGGMGRGDRESGVEEGEAPMRSFGDRAALFEKASFKQKFALAKRT